MKKERNFVYKAGDGLYINLTNKCSNNCAFCIRKSGGGGEGVNLWLEREPSAAEVIADLEKSNWRAAKEIVFCGYGEPTYKTVEIAAIGKYIKGQRGKGQNSPPVRLNTNGHGNLINGRDITGTLKGSVDIVSVSLNNSTAADYQKSCQSEFGEDGYGAMLEFTRLCVAKKIKTIMSVVNTIGADEIEKCREICRDLGAEFRVRIFE